MNDNTRSEPQAHAVGAQVERPVGRPVQKRGKTASWFVFGVLWLAGLALGDRIMDVGNDFSGAWFTLYGGLWMLLCSEMQRAALVLWSADDEGPAHE